MELAQGGGERTGLLCRGVTGPSAGKGKRQHPSAPSLELMERCGRRVPALDGLGWGQPWGGAPGTSPCSLSLQELLAASL